MFAFLSRLFAKGATSTSVPVLTIREVRSDKEYKDYVDVHQETRLANWLFEQNLIPDGRTAFKFYGYCYVCRTHIDFLVDFNYCNEVDGIMIPNWRERLVCPQCHLNNRMRATVHIFNQEFQPDIRSNIYLTEQTTILYKWFEQSFKQVCGSEYLGDSAGYGMHSHEGIRNEDLTHLSFDDDTFDFILSFDVFEHIPNYRKAISECCRCLRPGGILYFSVPFASAAKKNIVRASVSDTGEMIYLLPPEYHGNPLTPDGCLCFYHFGWELLDEINAMGFEDAKALLYWSGEYGYLGGEQLIFTATKISRHRQA